MNRVLVAGLTGLLTLAACAALPEVGPYPGEPWVDALGETVPPEAVALYADDCVGRESAALLDVQWPLIPTPGVEDEQRVYVRDPGSVMPTTQLLAPYDSASALPRGARFTGYTSGPFQLWAAADEAIYLYLVYGTRVEALPRALDDDVPCV
jgi:hypothetical protein